MALRLEGRRRQQPIPARSPALAHQVEIGFRDLGGFPNMADRQAFGRLSAGAIGSPHILHELRGVGTRAKSYSSRDF
jgi:hypothetical protein